MLFWRQWSPKMYLFYIGICFYPLVLFFWGLYFQVPLIWCWKWKQIRLSINWYLFSFDADKPLYPKLNPEPKNQRPPKTGGSKGKECIHMQSNLKIIVDHGYRHKLQIPTVFFSKTSIYNLYFHTRKICLI